VILYLFFGGMTTLINVISYALFTRICGLGTTASTALAWVAAVIFAYLTNRIWVFRSRARGAADIFKEASSFFGARFFSGFLEIAIMFVFVEKLGLNDWIMKILSTVIVIILNYFFSKLWIFRKKKEHSRRS